MERKWKLARNIVVCLLCAILIWWLGGKKPMPKALHRQLAWKAHFMEEPPEIWSDGTYVLSKGQNKLYLYQYGRSIIDAFPLEHGSGIALAGGTDLLAYETSGSAVKASMEYVTHHDGQPYVYKAEAEKTGAIFRFTVQEQKDAPLRDRIDEREAISNIFKAYRGNYVYEQYTLTIRFYDTDGALVTELLRTRTP